jgi:deazaflavin-dependent oxidoreductase (nitroreductase family)
MTNETIKPSAVERVLNAWVGKLFRMGWAPSYGHELEVVGRASGAVHRTPVNLLEHDGQRCLVSPRGETQWVKNARASGEVTLVRKANRTRYRVSEVAVAQRAPILKAYLMRYESQVTRFFSVAPSAPLEVFAEVAHKHPVFVLSPFADG